MFRIEIWVNCQITEDEVNKAKEFLKKEFGCPGIIIKDM